ncbi:LuxR C-terminal-related transcriptional regulator [Streptomyces sp. NPDC005963]|uniref:LuxR C-terminal-related transcriptional regulator n=1 Tax=Streptomyces sp. NPDC005963 TaxID=3156721 RepID=UPI0033FBA6D4
MAFTSTVELGRVRHHFNRRPETAREALADAILQTQEELDELRALSRGIAPPILVDRGLHEALAALAARSTTFAELDAAPLDRRPQDAVATAAYFVVAEALTNAAKQQPRAAVCDRATPPGGHPEGMGEGRWSGRRGTGKGARSSGAGGSAARSRRPVADQQPARWPDHDHRGAAMLTPYEAASEPARDPTAGGGLRIVVADDSVLLREGLARLLVEDGHQVVAAVGDGPSLVRAVLEHRPDASIVDIRMPPTHTDEGLRAAIAVRLPGTPVLIVSQYVETSYAGELLVDGCGAIGYLLKDRVARVDEFLDALGRVAYGGTVLDPQVIAQLLTGRRGSALAALTARERQILALMAEGHSNTAIAERLVVSASTVEKHIGTVFAKLGLPPDDARHRRVLAVLTYLRG